MTEQQTPELLDENKLIAERRAKLEKLREGKQHNGHPNTFRRSAYAADMKAQHGHKETETLANEKIVVSMAGRVMRRGGPFVGIQDNTDSIQFYLPKNLQKDSQAWELLDIGDIVGVTGELHKSGKGELYVNVQAVEDLELITKSLRPLPDKFHGLADQEMKYRQRYVDLIINDETRKTFAVRSAIINGIRSYLTGQGFMEVETPMLHIIPGGASAKPFVTHHNALDVDMYLRIAPELYLKRLVVGGFDRVFEINRNFRNEGLSTRHNPEFTMIEFYQAYADYRDMMDHTENMLRYLAKTVLGTTDVQYGDSVYDFAKPFTRISMVDAILKYNPTMDEKVLRNPEANMETLKDYARSVGVHLGPKEAHWGAGKLICVIFEETAEHKLDQPTFITEYPWEVSPLARRNDNDPFITDRFEFFVGGRELANGFSELNDAEDQAARFRRQVEEKDAGDDEAMHYDADYINALEYGLPPTAGEGIGIDRLVMLFTNSHTIKDVILFPHMKPRAE